MNDGIPPLIRTASRLMGRGLERFVKAFVPRRYKLAFSYRIAQLLGCEPELTFIDRLGPNRGVAIDAGANAGLFTFRLAKLYDRVVAFEINPSLAANLQQLAPHNVTVNAIGLSSDRATSLLHTPISRGVRLDGWASLEEGNCPDADYYTDTKVEVRTLDSFGIRGVTFLKADVEGHEVQLLHGARETISRDRPVVLLEVRERNRQAVRAYFDELGYAERRLRELINRDGSAQNFIYKPE